MFQRLVLSGCVATMACMLPVLAANTSGNKSVKADKSEATTAKKTIREAWSPQTLSGKILMVDAAQKLVVVKGPDGVPFDLDVTRSTRIRSGTQKLNLQDLSADLQKNVSVHYVPERSGDIARSIQVTG